MLNLNNYAYLTLLFAFGAQHSKFEKNAWMSHTRFTDDFIGSGPRYTSNSFFFNVYFCVFNGRISDHIDLVLVVVLA